MKSVCVLVLLLFTFPTTARDIRIIAVGDVGLNRSRVRVHTDGANVFGKMVPWKAFTKGFRGLLRGDIKFMNLETVVTDRNDLSPRSKAYNFRTHPNGVVELLRAGFNLVSLANNHAFDFGPTGIRETLKHFSRLKRRHRLNFAGAGKDLAAATKPVIFKVQGRRFAFSAVGIGSGAGARRNRPGIAHISQWKRVLQRLKRAKADFKILSVHIGRERDNRPLALQLRIFRSAIQDYGVNLVLGHHAHVVQGVEAYRGGLILYGLGNFMLRGARNMGSLGVLRNTKDFGLLANIRIRWNPKRRRFQFVSIKAIPVYDMHSGAHPFKSVADAHRRIDTLNAISRSSYLNHYLRGGPKVRGRGLVFRKVKGRPYGVYAFRKRR